RESTSPSRRRRCKAEVSSRRRDPARYARGPVRRFLRCRLFSLPRRSRPGRLRVGSVAAVGTRGHTFGLGVGFESDRPRAVPRGHERALRAKAAAGARAKGPSPTRRFPLVLVLRELRDANQLDEEWALQDSNLGASGYEPAALTTELRARKGRELAADVVGEAL